MNYDPNLDSGVEAGSAEVSTLLQQARQRAFRGGQSAARPLYDRALSLAKASSDELGQGNALQGIGFADAMAGRHKEARLAYQEALGLFRQGGHRVQEAYLLNAFGHLEEKVKSGDARRYFEQAADAFNALHLRSQEQMARRDAIRTDTISTNESNKARAFPVMGFVDNHDRAQTSALSSHGSFRVTLVDFTPVESTLFEEALRRSSFAFETKREASVGASSFPESAVHAIVFTATSLARVNAADVDAVRSATKPGTCRAYLFVSPGSLPPSGASPLDDFIQRTPTHDSEVVAGQIIDFFREADDLNRRSTRLALRDFTCLGAYKFIKALWPFCYVFAALHILNTIAVLAGRGPWPGVLSNPYVVPAASFFGAFFIVHCVFVIVRNALFGSRIVKRLDIRFGLGAAAFGLSAAATARSIVAIDQSTSRILISTALAVAVYTFYMYARRIRAECTSLSELQAAMSDLRRRIEVLNAIGKQPITSGTFPFLPFRARSLFISYMHSSRWSSETAAMIHRCTADHGFKVFLDRSTIPSGSLWRQFLLRALSECACFIAVLDGECAATDWVLAESAYATMLRKSIGKPRILLVIRNAEGLRALLQGPFGLIYMDVFQLPLGLCNGAATLVGDGQVTPELTLRAIEELRPMCLLATPHIATPSPLMDTEGHVSTKGIIALIEEKASRFRYGVGMVLVIQLSWKVQVYFVDGIPLCSWRFADNQLSFGRMASAFAEPEGPITFELQKRSFARLQKDLRSHFRSHDLKVTPLSKYKDEQWGMRISFGHPRNYAEDGENFLRNEG